MKTRSTTLASSMQPALGEEARAVARCSVTDKRRPQRPVQGRVRPGDAHLAPIHSQIAAPADYQRWAGMPLHSSANVILSTPRMVRSCWKQAFFNVAGVTGPGIGIPVSSVHPEAITTSLPLILWDAAAGRPGHFPGPVATRSGAYIVPRVCALPMKAVAKTRATTVSAIVEHCTAARPKFVLAPIISPSEEQRSLSPQLTLRTTQFS
jgi:hypothetical protein